MGTDDAANGTDIALSRLEQIHAALERVYACLDRPDGLSAWQADFLRSLDRQLHRGLALTEKQAVVLDRICQRSEGQP
jgi:hypothetical protein